MDSSVAEWFPGSLHDLAWFWGRIVNHFKNLNKNDLKSTYGAGCRAQKLHRNDVTGENAMIHTHGKHSWSGQLIIQLPGLVRLTPVGGVPENRRDQSGLVMTC